MSTQQRRPVGTEAPSRFSVAAVNSSVPPTPIRALLRHEIDRLFDRVDVAEAVRVRAAEEALSDALACTWRRRAELLEWARPRPGEYAGRATVAELAERDSRLALQAEACRNKARLLEAGLLDETRGWFHDYL